MISIRVIWCRLSRLRWHWKSVIHHLWCAEYVTTGFDRIKSSSACETAFRDHKSQTAHAHPGKMSRFGFYFIFIFLLIKSPSLILFLCFAVFVYVHYRMRWKKTWGETSDGITTTPPPPPFYSPSYGLLKVFRLFFQTSQEVFRPCHRSYAWRHPAVMDCAVPVPGAVTLPTDAHDAW